MSDPPSSVPELLDYMLRNACIAISAVKGCRRAAISARQPGESRKAGWISSARRWHTQCFESQSGLTDDGILAKEPLPFDKSSVAPDGREWNHGRCALRLDQKIDNLDQKFDRKFDDLRIELSRYFRWTVGLMVTTMGLMLTLIGLVAGLLTTALR